MDAKPCTLRRLLLDLEETGHTDVTVNSHDLTRPSSSDSTLLLCDFHVFHPPLVHLKFCFDLRWFRCLLQNPSQNGGHALFVVIACFKQRYEVLVSVLAFHSLGASAETCHMQKRMPLFGPRLWPSTWCCCWGFGSIFTFGTNLEGRIRWRNKSPLFAWQSFGCSACQVETNFLQPLPAKEISPRFLATPSANDAVDFKFLITDRYFEDFCAWIPGKPLYFMKQPLALSENEVVRLIWSNDWPDWQLAPTWRPKKLLACVHVMVWNKRCSVHVFMSWFGQTSCFESRCISLCISFSSRFKTSSFWCQQTSIKTLSN